MPTNHYNLVPFFPELDQGYESARPDTMWLAARRLGTATQQVTSGQRCFVSYDHRLLWERISLNLHSNPRLSLGELSRELHVCRRTIQNAIGAVTGKTLRDVRDEALLEKAKNLFLSSPKVTIKEVSFQAGYASPRAFARAIRRASCLSAKQFRSRVAG